MGIIDALFFKYFGPVFIKEDSDAESFIEKMKSLSSRASGKLKEKIDDIKGFVDKIEKIKAVGEKVKERL